jgi:predicted Rossmann fold flavoprotein
MNSEAWDIIVIGGGPAGMMAAGRAAELGKSVLLLEKNQKLGKKLLITGGGRCNVTNNKPEMKVLVSSYRDKPKALFSVFSQYSVNETLDFFHNRGLETKVEAEDRVFPITDKAESVWQVLLDYITETGVEIRHNLAVSGIVKNETEDLFEIKVNNEVLKSKSCIVATGGKSRPETGSTGEGFEWLKKLGHKIIDKNLALVPVSLNDKWTKQLSGFSLIDIKVSVFQDGIKHGSRTGKMLFTHFGVSGPAVLNLSSTIGELLNYGSVNLEVDLVPDLDQSQFKDELYRLMEAESNKKIKNTLRNLIPGKLVLPVLELAKVNPEKFNNIVNKEERKSLIKIIKGIPLSVKSLLGANKAIVSSGGVEIDEVNFQTMESKIVENLYLVGDVLNIDRPSGGYSLQICWSSRYVKGRV